MSSPASDNGFEEDEVEKKVQMTPEDWRKAADEAVEQAVGWMHSDDKMVGARANALRRAAEFLRAADTFRGHANMLEIEGGVDETTVEVWEGSR